MSDGPLVGAVSVLGIPATVIETPAELLNAKRSDFGLSAGAIVRTANRFFTSQPVITRIAQIIKSENIDIAYTNSSKAHVLGGYAGRRAGVPVIWHYRDYNASSLQRRFFARLSNKAANVVVCNSSFTATQFKGHRDARVVLNGLPVESVRPSRAAADVRAELGLTAGNLVAGTAGRLENWKGLTTFLRAAAISAAEFPEARFVIAGGPIYGDEAFADELKTLAEMLGISDKIIFTGFRKDIYDIINIYNVFVHPSAQPEPFGRGIVEAMLLGKPVVVSARGGPEEIVVGGGTGLFFIPKDEKQLAALIATLFRDPERAETFGKNGRRRAESKFSINRVVEEIEKIIVNSANLYKTK